MTLTIRFLGLITHANVGGDVAVVYDAPAHQARLVVERRFIQNPPPLPDDPPIECFDLTDRTISFNGLSGPVDRSGLIGVPNLNSIGGSGGTVSPDVSSRTTTGVFSAFVEVAGGRYGIEDYYANRVTYNGVDEICLPQTILFESPIATTVVVNGLGATLTLTANATITILNAEPTIVSPAPHYMLYGNFFTPPATITVPMVTGDLCPDGNPEPNIPKCPNEFKHIVGVECSNSQYP